MSHALIYNGTKTMIRVVISCFLLTLSMQLFAASEKTSANIGSISGTITVRADGQVGEVLLNNTRSAALNDFLTKKVKTWQFNPIHVNGEPVDVTTGIQFYVITTFDANQKIKSIAIQNIYIEPTAKEKQAHPRLLSRPESKRISYPAEALRSGSKAMLTIAMKISPEGRAVDSAITELALVGVDRRASSTSIKQFAEKNFAQSALEDARNWHWSREELEYYQCSQGCIFQMYIFYGALLSARWETYAPVSIVEPSWLSAESNAIISNNSQLVRFKEQPSNLPIEIGG